MTIPTADHAPTFQPAVEIGDGYPTALYRLYAASGELLYVGITDNLRRRFEQHAAEKAWWPEVARKTAEWHPDRTSAAKAERWAIRRESPIHNMRGFGVFDVRPSVSGAEVAEIVLSNLAPTAMRLALLELLGMSTKDALDAMGVARQNRYRVLHGRADAVRNARRRRQSA